MYELLWWVFAVLAVVSAVGVVVIRKALYSAFMLILHMLCISGLFALLRADFLAVMQIIVYAGAVMVLVVFVIMLLSLRGMEKTAGFAMIVMGVLGSGALGTVVWNGIKDVSLTESRLVGDVKIIGDKLFTQYMFTFEVASMLIIAALVGAIMLAKRSKKE